MAYEDINGMVKDLFDADPNEHVIDMSDFLFEGFDPEAILSELLKTVLKKKIGKEVFKQDMCTVIAIACNRGPISTKILSRMKEDGKERVMTMVSKYGIKMDIASDKLSRTDITSARIVNVFPFATMDICAGSDWARSFVGHFGSSDLPKGMLNTSFPACIPRGTICSEFLLRAYMLYAMDLADVTAFGGLDPDSYGAVYTKQIGFAQAAMNAKLFKNEDRIRKLKEHKFHEKDIYNLLVKQVTSFCSMMSYQYNVPSYKEYISGFKNEQA